MYVYIYIYIYICTHIIYVHISRASLHSPNPAFPAASPVPHSAVGTGTKSLSGFEGLPPLHTRLCGDQIERERERERV